MNNGGLFLNQIRAIDQRSPPLYNRTIMEYLIKWMNIPSQEVTWEDDQFLKKHPKLQALRENIFKRGGICQGLNPDSLVVYKLQLGFLGGIQ